MKNHSENRGMGGALCQFILACLLIPIFGLHSYAVSAPAAKLRPPAVPLVAHDPYFSIWSPADRLTDATTVHWTGKPQPLVSLIRIDGKAFRIMGKEPSKVPALTQTDLEVMPTRTIYQFEAEAARLTLTFMTPALPDDLDILARPVTYLTYDVCFNDGKTHNVQVYFEASAVIAVNDPRQVVVCSEDRSKKNAVYRIGVQDEPFVFKVGTKDQPILRKRGDDLRIDWGQLYITSPHAFNLGQPNAIAFTNLRDSFIAGGVGFINNCMGTYECEAGDLTYSVFFDFGEVASTPVSRWLMLAYDDEYSIKYFGSNLRPYWRRNGDGAAALLQKASSDYSSLIKRCAVFDARLMDDLRRVGGEKYAQLSALVYRQTLAGNKIVADANGKPLMFPKENFSNGCVGTVDVLFPQAPFFLVFSPALTKAMLVPILDYAASARWPYGYAPHDLGTYPHATGQVYGMEGKDGDRMPVEESGNMLIMLAALAREEGNADLANHHWSMLAKWADYLVNEGFDPQNQLCSADMFGRLPRAVNLALKAIIGIGGYAQLCEMTGRAEDAKKYLAIARDYAARWRDMSKDDGRTRLAYHLPGTWGMKHNLIWDRVLGLNLFPDSVGDAEVAWYLKVQNKYGLPVDNRTDTCLLDWALWSIAPARNDSDFQELLDPLWCYVQETPSRVPLSDWFVTVDAKQKGFQARPVVGGVFIKMLSDSSIWTKWAHKGANTSGPWAPIPVGGPMKTIMPSAQKEPVIWRYTLDNPGEDWFKAGFDDSRWLEGPGVFGTEGTPGAFIRTEWKTPKIWLRREFKLTDQPIKNLRLLLLYDEDPEIYLNGVLAAKLTGWSTSYEDVEISREAIATLKPGKNIIAIRASQTYGGQCIDVGLFEESPVGAVETSPAYKSKE